MFTSVMASNSKKGKAISLDTKVEIVNEVEKGSKNDIAKEYGLASSTFSTILKNKDVILENYNSEGFGQNRKRFHSGNFTDIENALFTWFVKARSEKIPIRGPILASKAEVLAKKLNYENFKASYGFNERFKQRRNIVNKTSSGESASVKLDWVQKWKEKLPSLINAHLRMCLECFLYRW